MSKKTNKRIVNKAARRVLNKGMDFLKQASGRWISGHKYGSGISRSSVKDSSNDE